MKPGALHGPVCMHLQVCAKLYLNAHKHMYGDACREGLPKTNGISIQMSALLQALKLQLLSLLLELLQNKVLWGCFSSQHSPEAEAGGSEGQG